MDPFTQQVVQYKTRNVQMPNMNASLPRSNTLSRGGKINSDPVFAPMDLSLKAAIYNGLYDPSGSAMAIKPDCPTGNCTFPAEHGASFSTLGVCSHCAETTHDIQTVCFNDTSVLVSNRTLLECQHTLPNGQQLIAPANNIWMVANSALESINGSIKFSENNNTAFTHFSMLSYVGRNCTTGSICHSNSLTLFAVECALSFCVKIYTASVENNALIEEVVSQFSSVSPLYTMANSSLLVPDTCVVTGKSRDLASCSGNYPNNTAYMELYKDNTRTYVHRDCVYQIRDPDLMAIVEYFMHYFDGAAYKPNSPEVDSNPDDMSFNPDDMIFNPDNMQVLYNAGNATLETVNNTFANLATAMTNNMRQDGQRAQGLTYKNELYVHVRWAWLTLPITLVFLSITFLTITMIQSANANVWKSSSLALLYHGLRDGQHQGPVDSIQQMEELARSHQVALRRTRSHDDLKLT